MAVVVAVLGVVTFALQPGAPEAECAAKGAASSGFEDPGRHCAISVASWKKIAEYDSSPKWFRIVGLLLILAAVVVAVVALVKLVRARKREAQAVA